MRDKIMFPHAGIVLMMGPSSSGKTTLLQQLISTGVLQSSEVISSDQFRVLVSDNEFLDWKYHPKEEADALMEEYQLISKEAFAAMDYVVETRCRLNKLTIIDATHLRAEDRTRYVQLARKQHVPIVVIALDVAEEQLFVWDENRDHQRGKKRIKQQYQTFKRQLRFLKKEGYTAQYVISGEEVSLISFGRKTNRLLLDVGNGLDFIGDIHGCFDELMELLGQLGYKQNEAGYFVHPEGRKLVSVGDVMSRGPKSLATLHFFHQHIEAGLAYMIDSNHGFKVAKWLDGRQVQMKHGDDKLVAEFADYEQKHGKETTDQLKQTYKQLLQRAPSHLVIQKNGLSVAVIVHAGIRDEYIGKQSPSIADFCRYGDTDGFDATGKPIRKDWTTHHKSNKLIIWGHDPKQQPIVVDRTVNIDQGVVFGGSLTALRFPERDFVSVKAKEDYAQVKDSPLRKWEAERLAPPNINRFLAGYSVLTEHMGEVKIKSPFVKSALDDLSHYTIPIEELVYIAPTMSPTPEVSALPNHLEHPLEAFAYYRSNGIQKMVVEKKHMGSRGILLLFRDRQVAKKRINRETFGVMYTRTGRSFFNKQLEQSILEKLNREMQPYFAKYETEFVLLDAEILPWNLKAKELIQHQYAHVGEMALLDRIKRKEQLVAAWQNGAEVAPWLEETGKQLEHTSIFREVFQHYLWDVDGLEGIQIAPFHTLAHSGKTFFDQTHLWHMQKNQEFSQLSDLFIDTEYQVVEDNETMQDAITWWEAMTESGHEGFVVKPFDFISRNHKGNLLQPAIKVRGAKYLHIIYGMDYLELTNLARLKQRGTNKKQRNALREFALGLEGVQRFVNGESLTRMHECVLGTLAMEADPIDPRL